MAFDGITTKVICDEIQNICGSRIDKVFQPNKNEIVLGLYLDGKNYALSICIDSQNYRINLTTHQKSNPQVAPNFCMLLRKHLIGLKLKNVVTSNLERVVILEIEGFDEFEDVVSKKLIIELMGKHGNIILLDESNIIIDSLRHIKNNSDNENILIDRINNINNSNTRNILPHVKYNFPTINKINFLDVKDFNDFKNKLVSSSVLASLNDTSISLSNISKLISDTYNGISKIFVENIINILNITSIDDNNLEKIYNYLLDIIQNSPTSKLQFNNVELKKNNKVKKDYFLSMTDDEQSLFSLNFFIDDFYYDKESSEGFKSYQSTVLKLILNDLKKYNTRLSNMDLKLEECTHMEKYKLYGELITANLYKIENKNLEVVTLENYYDNNNLITIPLDKKYLPSINAKRFFKKYSKLKNTLEIVTKQKEETIQELNYLESIVYELEAATSTDDVAQIFDEISENVLFKTTIDKTNKKSSKIKKSKLTKNKDVTFNPIKYTFDGYTILVGRNNKENDYLTLKYANKSDLWFHTKDIHGSHVILKTQEKNITDEILYKCASLAVEHSKGKNSSNVPVDYCPVKYVKKPNGAKPGMVIYTNNKTIYVKS